MAYLSIHRCAKKPSRDISILFRSVKYFFRQLKTFPFMQNFSIVVEIQNKILLPDCWSRVMVVAAKAPRCLN